MTPPGGAAGTSAGPAWLLAGVAFAAGVGVGGWWWHTPGAGPAPGADPAATRADMGALARSLEDLRLQVERLRAERPDPEALFFAGERARFRAALRRQRAQVVAWRESQSGEKRDVADRAIQTIDAFIAQLGAITDVDQLAAWFDRTVSTRQQWPPQHAWLLPELLWK